METITFTESGFEVTMPEGAGFRLGENPHYQNLSHLHLKEMDVGWWDDANNELVFLELKGVEIWEGFDQPGNDGHAHMTESIQGKITDVLLIMAAVWVGTRKGGEIGESLPGVVHRYPGEGNLKFVVLVDTPQSHLPLLSPVNDEINKKLAGRTRLFGVDHIGVIDFDTAVKMGLPVTRAE